jgi:NAD(P)-dependent dehydrogenase (short-subunit alcohol dehydrogenase family)
MLEDRKILVTGATVHIAGPIAENFANHNEVWCAARFSDPNRKKELKVQGIKPRACCASRTLRCAI